MEDLIAIEKEILEENRQMAKEEELQEKKQKVKQKEALIDELVRNTHNQFLLSTCSQLIGLDVLSFLVV